MSKFLSYFVPLLCFCEIVTSDAHPDINANCGGGYTSKDAFEVSIRSARNASGEWNTRIEGRKNCDNKTDNMAVDFKHQVIECGKSQTFHFLGIFGENPGEGRIDRLFFHKKCGTNVAISNNGRTVQKINGEERFNGVVFTNRPLRPNELFEVVVDKRVGSKFGYFMGIAVTTLSPYDIEIPNHLNTLRGGVWILYHNHLYHDGNLIVKNRSLNMDQLKVGDRVGIMVSDSGSLFVYFNGKEEGAAASNIPFPVYGGFELYGDQAQCSLTS